MHRGPWPLRRARSGAPEHGAASGRPRRGPAAPTDRSRGRRRPRRRGPEEPAGTRAFPIVRADRASRRLRSRLRRVARRGPGASLRRSREASRSRVDPMERVRVAALRRELRDLSDPAHTSRVAFLMHDNVDAAPYLLANGLERQIDATHEGHRLDPHQRVWRAVRVRGGQGPAVPGIHRLQHVQGFPTAHLANDDPIGAHAERRSEKRTHVDGSGPFDARSTRFERDHVGLRKAELRGVLDGHDAFAVAHGERKRVERRRLAARGAAGDEDASPPAYRADEVRHGLGRQRPVANEVVGAERPLPEAANREDGPDERYGRDYRVHSRTIGKSRVDERTCEVDASAERRDEPLDQHEDLLRIGEMDRGLLKPSIALNPDAAGAIDHDLGHAVVTQERCELAEAKEPVFQPALEQAQLARRDDEALVHERLAQGRRELLATGPAIGRFTKTRDDAAFDAGARGDRHVASIAMISANSSYAFPIAPPSALGRDVAAATAPSARGSARNTSRPVSEADTDCDAISHASSGTSAAASAATEIGSS